MKSTYRARSFGRAVFLAGAFLDWTIAIADNPPTGCTDISQIPPTNEIDFAAGINSLFAEFSQVPHAGCADCHTSNDGGQTPAGWLNLDPNDPNPDATPPYSGIVKIPSVQEPQFDYVSPNRPELSYLFMKINCDSPPSGARMPYGETDLFTPAQQAFIYDWIAGGATIETTSTIFRGTFDIRGFFVDKVFRSGFEP